MTSRDVARLVKFLLRHVAFNIEQTGHANLILPWGQSIKTWQLRNLASFGIPDELPLQEGWREDVLNPQKTGYVRRIGKAGEVAIPWQVWQQIGLEAGDAVEVLVDGHEVILRGYIGDAGQGD